MKTLMYNVIKNYLHLFLGGNQLILEDPIKRIHTKYKSFLLQMHPICRQNGILIFTTIFLISSQPPRPKIKCFLSYTKESNNSNVNTVYFHCHIG